MADLRLILVALAIVLFLLVRGMWRVAIAVLKDIGLALIWRHFSGAHYHGNEITDAGWFTHGATVYRKNGRASKWEHKPRAHRALWRTGCTFAFFGVIYGAIADRAVTVHAVMSMGVYGVLVLAFVTEAYWRLRLHRRHTLNPIVKSLAVILRMSPHAVRRMVHIEPANITSDGEIGYIELPPELTPGADQQSSMERVIGAHLPVDVELDMQLQQAPKMAVIRAAQKPPVMVEWDEIVPAMEKAAAGDVIIGKDRTKGIYSANFINLDDPHWAFCVQSKRGKSNFLGLTAVQILHQDPQAQVMAIDPKRSSLIDFLGSPAYPGPGLKPLLPGVTMANDPMNPEAMAGLVAKAKRLFDSRSAEAALDRGRQFPVCLVIVDELNLLRQIINDMWADALAANRKLPKEEREDLPGECPMWRDIRTLLQAGRFVGIHVLAVAQNFTDDVIGGKGARSFFGLRGLGGYYPNQWKMFVGTTPIPLAQNGVGRWIFTQGESQEWVQVAYADPDKAYAWASAGRELYHDESSVLSTGPGDHAPSLLTYQTDGLALSSSDRTPAAAPMVIGLDAGAAYARLSRAAFEKARQRTESDGRKNRIPGEVRIGGQPAWLETDLDDWKRNRPRAGRDGE